MKIIDLFNEKELVKVFNKLQKDFEVEEEINFEISAYQFLKYINWLGEAIESYKENKLYILDRENSPYNLDEYVGENIFTTEIIPSKKELIKRFDSEFFQKNILEFIPLLEKTSNLSKEELWDMIQFNVLYYLKGNSKDELYIYLQNRYEPLKKEIREMLGPSGEEYVLVRNTCCGRYKTNKGDNCRVCPFING